MWPWRHVQQGQRMQEQEPPLVYLGIDQYYASLPPSRVAGQAAYNQAYIPHMPSSNELINAGVADQSTWDANEAPTTRGTAAEEDEAATMWSNSPSPTENNSDDEDCSYEGSSSSSYTSSSSRTTSTSSVSSSSSNNSVSSLFAVRSKPAAAERPLSRNGNSADNDTYSTGGLDYTLHDQSTPSSPPSGAPVEQNDNTDRPHSHRRLPALNFFSRGSSAKITNDTKGRDDEEDNNNGNNEESKLGLTRSVQDDFTRHTSHRRLSPRVSFTDDIILHDATPQEQRPASRRGALPRPMMRYMVIPQRRLFAPQRQFSKPQRELFVPQRELVEVADANASNNGESHGEAFLPPLANQPSSPPSRHMSRSSSQLSTFMSRLKSSLSFRRHRSRLSDGASPDSEDDEGETSDMRPRASREVTSRRHAGDPGAEYAIEEPTSSNYRFANRQIASAPPCPPRRPPGYPHHLPYYPPRTEYGYLAGYKTLPSIPRSSQVQQQQYYVANSMMRQQQQQQQLMQRPSFYYPYYNGQPMYAANNGSSFYSLPFPRPASSHSLGRYPSQTYM